uniref:NADH dehydrogenase subunit 4L n=1 Tax=Cyclosa japonica TaxID=1112403 RepID=A0A5B9RSJ9_9ARAC|nr:NADH dehydrogenase subunit 4L [Cyclosa japonica]QEG58637.1 NADH dehydrogenase subunit 4L [Cyclosa japonica]
MIIISITSLWWWRKNIIIILLSLELMLMSTFMLISVNIASILSPSLLSMLTIMVAGSSFGLILMVSLCRFFKSPNSSPVWMMIFDKNNFIHYINKWIIFLLLKLFNFYLRYFYFYSL